MHLLIPDSLQLNWPDAMATIAYDIDENKIKIELGFEGGVTEHFINTIDDNTTKITRVLHPDK